MRNDDVLSTLRPGVLVLGEAQPPQGLTDGVRVDVIGPRGTRSLTVAVDKRRRESALLRALGVTRGQVKGMLALEGLLLAGVGTVLGVPLGVAYGLAGALGLLGLSDIPSSIVVPVGPLGAVGGVALLAGLIASVLPGRRAARVAPAVAIALA